MPCVTDTGETAADGVSGQKEGEKKQLTFNAALLKALTKHCKSELCQHCVTIPLFKT